jgi:hypothetical protein
MLLYFLLDNHFLSLERKFRRCHIWLDMLMLFSIHLTYNILHKHFSKIVPPYSKYYSQLYSRLHTIFSQHKRFKYSALCSYCLFCTQTFQKSCHPTKNYSDFTDDFCKFQDTIPYPTFTLCFTANKI